MRCFTPVSIHAPAWGATSTRPAWASHRTGFNPRARVGRDFLTLSVCRTGPTFQSTRPRGARRFLGLADCAFKVVSIHAPAWGATSTKRAQNVAVGSFNPRARVGRDSVPSASAARSGRFNPRARVGRDGLHGVGHVLEGAVSIHAPAWGATLARLLAITGGSGFQSTRPRGARPPHHNSLRDKDFFRVIREPLLPLDPKGTGQVAATQKANEISMLLKCEPSRESRTA